MLEEIWKEFNERISEMQNEQYIIWKLLKSRYEMLLSKRDVTDIQLEEFKQLTMAFGSLIEV
jgi:DNA-directed RNA polymerase subunit N (RpoN/RPB10)